MPSVQVEQRLGVDVGEPDGVDDLDPRYVDCIRVFKAAYKIHQTLQVVDDSPMPAQTVATQEYVDEIEAAVRAGRDLVEHPENDRARTDMSALDDATLRELRATLGYVAPHVGVELSLPAPTPGGETA